MKRLSRSSSLVIRAAMAEKQAPAWWEGASQQLVKEQEQNLTKNLGPMKKDIQDMKQDIGGLKVGQQSLEARVGVLELGGGGGGGSSGEGWKPSFVEIVGFCKWEDRAAKGVSRTEASALLESLKGLVDPSIQCHVRDLSLRSGQNHIVKVPITPEYLEEIKNTWNDNLSKESNMYKGEKLRVRAERHPALQKRFQVMGKVADWAKNSLGAEFEPKDIWAPDFNLMITKSSEEGSMGVKPGCVLCHVAENSEIKWNKEGMKVVEIVSEMAGNNAVNTYRRPRR